MMRKRYLQRRHSTQPAPRRGRIPLLLASLMALAACGGSGGPPVLVRVAISPESSGIAPGRVQRFVAGGMWNDGRQGTPSVALAATGGTISDRGVFTAGVVPGAFRVTATPTGGGPTDTAIVVVGANRTYTTSFPLVENPISEGGNWVDGGTEGGEWSDVETMQGRATGLQCCRSYSDATALLTGDWRPDQQVTAVVFADRSRDDCFQEVEMRLRSRLAPHVASGYEISFKSSRSVDAYLIIVRWNGPFGDFTYLFNQKGREYGVRSGDVVRARMVGNVITAYKNGLMMAQVRDDTYVSGAPGMGFNLLTRAAGCSRTNRSYGFTRFTATDSV